MIPYLVQEWMILIAGICLLIALLLTPVKRPWITGQHKRKSRYGRRK